MKLTATDLWLAFWIYVTSLGFAVVGTYVYTTYGFSRTMHNAKFTAYSNGYDDGYNGCIDTQKIHEFVRQGSDI